MMSRTGSSRALFSPGSPIYRQLLITLLAAASLTFSGLATADQRWQRVPAVTAALDGKEPVTRGLALELPLVAEDGSAVNLSVRFEGDLEDSEYIQTIRLFAPGNPRAEVADYSLSQVTAPVAVTTRVRLSESQQVVALAFTNTGRAFLATRDVRVTVSGCLIGGDDDTRMQMENPRIAFGGEVRANNPVLVRTLINHPMETGLRPDGEDAEDIAQQLVESLTVTLDGEPVFRSRFYTGTSANPYVQFAMTPTQRGELNFQWQDQNGETVEEQKTLTF